MNAIRTPIALAIGALCACSDFSSQASSVTVGLPGHAALVAAGATAGDANTVTNPNTVATPNTPATPSSRVDGFSVRVHAASMSDPVTGTAAADANIITLSVPAGPQRTVEVMGLRSDTVPPLPTYFGSQTVDLQAGEDATLSLEIAPAGLLQGGVAVTSAEVTHLRVSLEAVTGQGIPITLDLDSNDIFSQPMPAGAYTVRGTVSLDGQTGDLVGNPNFVIQQGMATTLRVFVQLPGVCDSQAPLDHDGDGVTCDKDCDDSDVNNWNACKTCVDADKDGWRTGCDAYQTIHGPDCDDTSNNVWLSCSACADRDQDNYYAGCDAYASVVGPDCDDADRSNWVSCAACVDADADGSYLHCDAYFNRHGPDCDDHDVNNWISCDTCQDYDLDQHYVACDQYVTVGADCDDFDSANWASCMTCVDQDNDGHYVGCDSYTAGLTGPDCNDRFAACTTECTKCVPAAIDFAAVGGDGSISLNWGAIVGAVSYNMYVSTDPNVGPANAAGATVLNRITPPFTLRGVANGIPHYVTLTDINKQGKESIDAADIAVMPHPVFGAIIAAGAGTAHSAALKSDGSVWTWGDNSNGQLGVSGLTRSHVPVRLSGLPPVTQIAVGAQHNLALDVNGTVWGWGDNTLSQLGGTGARNTPMIIAGLPGIVQVAAGDTHSVAVDASGHVWAWGDNSQGAVGNGVKAPSQPTPVMLQGFHTDPITNISAAGSHTLAVDANHVLWSWGGNAYGEVGSGLVGTAVTGPLALPSVGSAAQVYATVTASFVVTPAGIIGFGSNQQGQLGNANLVIFPSPTLLTASGFVRLAGGTHTLALDARGRVYSFGNNPNGQLGRSTAGQDANVVQIVGLPSGMSVAASRAHSLLVASDGTLWAWGDNHHGQLGISGGPAEVDVPSIVGGTVQLAAGDYHSVALRSDGTVWAWGDNQYGQLGSSLAAGTFIAGQVPGLPAEIVAVAAGAYHTLALAADGNVWAWGDNSYDQLGSSTVSFSAVAHPVPGLPAIRAVAAGGYFSLAVDNANTVWVWGDNTSGQFGSLSPAYDSVPRQVTGLSPTVVSVAAGYNHILALTQNGNVWAWGDDTSSQLGAAPNAAGMPVLAVAGGVTAIAAGGTHSLALAQGGLVLAWGGDRYGQLADGNSKDVPAPQTLSKLGPFTQLACGYDFSMLANGNLLQGFGNNNLGQFGDGTYGGSSLSESVNLPGQGLRLLVSGSGSEHVLALALPNTVYAWGDDSRGQLGVPAPTQQGNLRLAQTPTVVSLSREAMDVRAGQGFSLAVANDGSVWTWGDNAAGQLGLGLATGPLSVYPVRVPLPPALIAAVGDQHVLVLDAFHTLWVWGSDSMGQLGDSSFGTRAVAHTIAGTYTSVAAAGNHSLALDQSGYLWSWGDNTHGQVGNNSSSVQAWPTQLSQFGSFAGAGAGACASFAWNGNQVTAWGCNGEGELGNGSTGPDVLIPTLAARLPANVMQLCGGAGHAAALLDNGGVYTWGDDRLGQLGDGGTTPRPNPQRVAGLPPISAIACGPNATVAVGTGGGIFAWGSSAALKLTSGTPQALNNVTPSAPFAALAAPGHASVSLSASHLLVHSISDAIVGSGDNTRGGLGNGTLLASPATFVQGI